jgi:hypothetical protein
MTRQEIYRFLRREGFARSTCLWVALGQPLASIVALAGLFNGAFVLSALDRYFWYLLGL